MASLFYFPAQTLFTFCKILWAHCTAAATTERVRGLSREGALETLQHLNRLTGYGIPWRSLTEQYLDSTGLFRDAVISILAVIAKQERVRLSERTRAGLERVRREGKVLGRPRANISPETVRHLRAQGLTWTAISRQLGVARATAQAYAVAPR